MNISIKIINIMEYMSSGQGRWAQDSVEEVEAEAEAESAGQLSTQLTIWMFMPPGMSASEKGRMLERVRTRWAKAF